MNVTIDLSEQSAAVLDAQARAANMPPERYPALRKRRSTRTGGRCLAASCQSRGGCLSGGKEPAAPAYEDLKNALVDPGYVIEEGRSMERLWKRC